MVGGCTSAFFCRVLPPGLLQFMDKEMHPPFPQDGLPKNCQELPWYNPYIHSCQDLQCSIMRLHRNQNCFWKNWSTTSQILTIRRILEGVQAKNLEATLLFVDFSKAFDSIHSGKMEQILLPYSLPKKTLADTMMLYKNMKVKVSLSDVDTDYVDIVVGVLQGDTLASYLFMCRLCA